MQILNPFEQIQASEAVPYRVEIGVEKREGVP
jgi:hypothetical protein